MTMSTIVYQGLQSFTEPQMMETTTIRLKLSSPDPESNGWNFIQTLTNISQSPTQVEPSYVHPMTKNSDSKLSIRSLELCTENLGCETGTNMIESTLFSLPMRESNRGENKERMQFRPRRCLDSKNKNIRNFPPPLTTMSGSTCMHVRPIREVGRLVIEAVEAPLSHGCFQAERSNGRLRLSLFKDLENDEAAPENEICKNGIEELEHEENYEEIEEGDFLDGDVEGNNKEFVAEMGIGKLQRPTRCNESGRCIKSLRNWGPFWVATS